MNGCQIEGCDEHHYARNWCTSHYHRWWLHGDPLAGNPGFIKGDDVARFWSKVEKTEICWLWTTTKNQGGYGQFTLHAGGRQRRQAAHRWAYEHLVGPIPSGLQLDHLCRIRACVNPAHLEPVTSRENGLRGNGPVGLHARATHCPHGHAYDEENTRVRPNGWRDCRACARSRSRSAA